MEQLPATPAARCRPSVSPRGGARSPRRCLSSRPATVDTRVCSRGCDPVTSSVAAHRAAELRRSAACHQQGVDHPGTTVAAASQLQVRGGSATPPWQLPFDWLGPGLTLGRRTGRARARRRWGAAPPCRSPVGEDLGAPSSTPMASAAAPLAGCARHIYSARCRSAHRSPSDGARAPVRRPTPTRRSLSDCTSAGKAAPRGSHPHPLRPARSGRGRHLHDAPSTNKNAAADRSIRHLPMLATVVCIVGRMTDPIETFHVPISPPCSERVTPPFFTQSAPILHTTYRHRPSTTMFDVRSGAGVVAEPLQPSAHSSVAGLDFDAMLTLPPVGRPQLQRMATRHRSPSTARFERARPDGADVRV